jgi:hypothetical protein
MPPVAAKKRVRPLDRVLDRHGEIPLERRAHLWPLVEHAMRIRNGSGGAGWRPAPARHPAQVLVVRLRWRNPFTDFYSATDHPQAPSQGGPSSPSARPSLPSPHGWQRGQPQGQGQSAPPRNCCRHVRPSLSWTSPVLMSGRLPVEASSVPLRFGRTLGEFLPRSGSYIVLGGGVMRTRMNPAAAALLGVGALISRQCQPSPQGGNREIPASFAADGSGDRSRKATVRAQVARPER